MSRVKQLRIPVGGFRRGGSSILFKLIELMCREDGVPAFDIVAHYDAMKRDVSEIKKKEFQKVFKENIFIGTFRQGHELLESAIETYKLKPIVIVRNPIDCVLSWYHARMLHSIPLGKKATWNHDAMTLSEFVKDRDDFYFSASSLVACFDKFDTLYIKYEDFVLNPMKALADISDHTGVNFSREAIDFFAVEGNFLNIAQNTESHNRSGLPGSMLQNCSQFDLDILNERYRDILKAFKYPKAMLRDEGEVPWGRVEIDSIKRICTLLLSKNHDLNEEVAKSKNIVDNISLQLPSVLSYFKDKAAFEVALGGLLLDISNLKHENGLRISEVSRLEEMLRGIDGKLDMILLRNKVTQKKIVINPNN